MTRDEPGQGDRRVQRTHRLIVEALIELTTQKGFAAVTVQDIVQRAGINRATFYRHYQDKFDLLDQYAQAVYALPDHAPDSGSPMGAETRTIPGVVRIFEHVREHAKFFRVMLGQNGDPAFVAKIRKYIQQRIRRSLPDAWLSDPASADVYVNYVSSGAIGVLTWWLEQEMPYSPEQLAAILSRFIGIPPPLSNLV